MIELISSINQYYALYILRNNTSPYYYIIKFEIKIFKWNISSILIRLLTTILFSTDVY